MSECLGTIDPFPAHPHFLLFFFLRSGFWTQVSCPSVLLSSFPVILLDHKENPTMIVLLERHSYPDLINDNPPPHRVLAQ